MQVDFGNSKLYLPDYDAERRKISDFLTGFQDPSATPDPIHGKMKYMAMLQKIANRQEKLINISLSDLHEFFSSSRDVLFVERIRANTSRYISEFSKVIDDKIPPPSITFD